MGIRTRYVITADNVSTYYASLRYMVRNAALADDALVEVQRTAVDTAGGPGRLLVSYVITMGELRGLACNQRFPGSAFSDVQFRLDEKTP